MGILSVFHRKKLKSSTSSLTAIQKEDIVALRDSGVKPSDISEELDLPVEQVSKVLELERRKLARISGLGTTTNPVTAAKEELEAARLQLQIQRLEFQKEQLQADRDEEFGDDEDDELNSIIKPLLMGFVKGKTETSTPTFLPSNPLPTPQQIDLTEEQISQILEPHKASLKQFQKLEDKDILTYLNAQYPQLSPETKARALDVLKKMGVE